MLYKNLKIILKKIPFIWSFLAQGKDLFLVVARLKDVFMMMLLFNIWPEQTYRFSTRKLLPNKNNKYFQHSKQEKPFRIIQSKKNNIKKVKEINLIARGSSFNYNNINNLKGPVFLVSHWLPLKVNDEGSVFYLYEETDVRYKKQIKEIPDNFRQLKNENLTYVLGSHEPKYVDNLLKNGHKVIKFEVRSKNQDGNLYISGKVKRSEKYKLSDVYFGSLNHELFNFIELEEKVYKHPILPPYSNWAPTGSFLPVVYMLLNYTEKMNIYGWDFYLESSPEKMSYWDLFFNMYKFDMDIKRSKNHFESALLNFYYGYYLSKLPNVNIYGYLGKLEKHDKLIKKIEKVLFN